MVSFSGIAAQYETEKLAPKKKYEDIALCIQKINRNNRQIDFKKRVISALEGDITDEHITRFISGLRCELDATRVSMDDFKITRVYKKRIHCYYNVKHATFYCYEKEYQGNKNWIPCGWVEKEDKHVIKHGLEKARDHFTKRMEKEIDVLQAELGVLEGQMSFAAQALIDGVHGDQEAA